MTPVDIDPPCSKTFPLNVEQRKFSVTGAALVLFFFISCVVWFASYFGIRPKSTLLSKLDFISSAKEIELIGKVSSWWIAKSYYVSSKAPEIVILGSSELGAIQSADGYAFNKVIDLTDDHRSYLLERFIGKLIGGKRRVLLASLPGMTISDQLILSSVLFAPDYKPEIVALAFTPRDFLDNIFSQPCKSEAFAFFSRYTDFASYQNIFHPEPRFDATYVFSLLPLRAATNQLREPFFSICSGRTLANPFERIRPHQILAFNLPPPKCKNDTDVYRRRYMRSSAPQIDNQFRSLDVLLALLKARRIKAVAFNFPLMEAHKKILSEDFLTRYDQAITRICQKNGADYISVDKAVQPFASNEFVDTVHLNALGGYRLCKTLALFISNKLGVKPFPQILAQSDQCFK